MPHRPSGRRQDVQGPPGRLRSRPAAARRGQGVAAQGFLYWSDDGDLFALRYEDWKVVFIEQRNHGFGVWQEGFDKLRVPKLFNLRADPFERADSSILYDKWLVDHAFVFVPAQTFVGRWLATFREFPPRQKPASFDLTRVMTQIETGSTEAGSGSSAPPAPRSK